MCVKVSGLFDIVLYIKFEEPTARKRRQRLKGREALEHAAYTRKRLRTEDKWMNSFFSKPDTSVAIAHVSPAAVPPHVITNIAGEL